MGIAYAGPTPIILGGTTTVPISTCTPARSSNSESMSLKRFPPSSPSGLLKSIGTGDGDGDGGSASNNDADELASDSEPRLDGGAW